MLIRKQATQFKKGVKKLNRYFAKENMQWQKLRCKILLVIRKTGITTIVRHNYTNMKMAKKQTKKQKKKNLNIAGGRLWNNGNPHILLVKI